MQLQEESVKWPVESLEQQYNEWKAKEYPVETDAYLNEKNAIYNLATMIELKYNTGDFFSEDIPTQYYSRFVNSINRYMDTYAPDQTDFKDYIRILSLYKTFIAKLPLHPPEMQIPGGGKVYKKGKNYFCTAKQQHIHDEDSLCRFCTAKMCEY
jgi:uncharacterized protein (UPF0305 family)